VPEGSASSVRAFCDANNVFDVSGYATHFQGFVVVSIWLQKNLAARELAINYFRETKNEVIEIIQ
jgi:hypothetical protein